jgi:hypothetical protein
VSAAAEALRRDPVFVDLAAERALTEIEADSLRAEIRSSGTPLFVAVLPGSAGDAGDVVRRLLQQTGLSGAYAAIAGDGFRATSTELADADELATAAFQAASSGGPAAVLLRFVDDVAAAPAGRSLPSGAGEGGTGQDDDGGGGRDVPSLVPIGLLAMGGCRALRLVTPSRRAARRPRRPRRRSTPGANRSTAEDGSAVRDCSAVSCSGRCWGLGLGWAHRDRPRRRGRRRVRQRRRHGGRHGRGRLGRRHRRRRLVPRTPAVLPAPDPSTPSDRLRARASSRFGHVRQESLPPVHLGRVG